MSESLKRYPRCATRGSRDGGGGRGLSDVIESISFCDGWFLRTRIGSQVSTRVLILALGGFVELHGRLPLEQRLGLVPELDDMTDVLAGFIFTSNTQVPVLLAPVLSFRM